jgi:hypothetical protein
MGTNTTGTVSGLAEGLTYYFVAVACDAEGDEAPPSNEISVPIPTNTPPTLAEALDTPGWTWTTGGNPPAWVGQTDTTHDGLDAARSGAIGDNQATWAETTVSGPGTLSFWWKVSSETNHDFLRFAVDGLEQASISGDADWVQANSALAAGSHTLRWTYTKDPSMSVGEDAGWVDQVSYTPLVFVWTLSVASLNPGSGVSVTGSPNDNSGQGSGVTGFTRTYNNGEVVILTAPATAGGNPFQKWQKDGADWATTQTTTATMDADHTMTRWTWVLTSSKAQAWASL